MNRSINDYLINIYQIQKNNNFVKTTELAEAMNYSPASITEMFRRMKSTDFVIYKPYKGAQLTKKGIEHAKIVLRRRYYITKLLALTGMPSDLAKNESRKIESDISDEAFEYISSYFGNI